MFLGFHHWVVHYDLGSLLGTCMCLLNLPWPQSLHILYVVRYANRCLAQTKEYRGIQNIWST